jgi:hypothetical protein
MDQSEKIAQQDPLYHDVDIEFFQENGQQDLIVKRPFLTSIFSTKLRWVLELWMLLIILFLLSLLRSRRCVEVMHHQAVRLEKQYPMPERK